MYAGRGSTQFSEHPHLGGRGHGLHFPGGRDCGLGRGRNIESGRVESAHQVDNTKQYIGVQYYVCNKYRHVKAQCWYRNKEEDVVKETKEEEEEEVAFMVAVDDMKENGGTWLIDSGFSNHILGDRMLFHSIKSTPKHSIKLGDDKTLQGERMGKISLGSSNGKITTLNNVQFVPHLAHNLLSIGQLMTSRYAMEFLQGECIMKEENSKIKVA